MWRIWARSCSIRAWLRSIVTARFDSRWPSEVGFREMAVHRLPFPQRFGWGTMRYMIALSRWLRRNQPDFDLVYVSHLSLEAHATIGALQGSGIPVVLRAEPDEPLDSASTHRRRRLARRVMRRCQMAAAVVTSSQATRERLLDAGFPADRVQLIPAGVELTAPRTQADQTGGAGGFGRRERRSARGPEHARRHLYWAFAAPYRTQPPGVGLAPRGPATPSRSALAHRRRSSA